MLKKITIDTNSQTPIYIQISNAISKQIEKDVLPKNTLLPSINILNERMGVARDTIEKAYKRLKKEGYITSVMGKGYYVSSKKKKKLSILLIFNKLSFFKKIIYYSLLEGLGNKANVELKIHHYNPKLLKEIIDNSLGKYDYYVIMPHFEDSASSKDYIDIINKIPNEELLLLDKNLDEKKGVMAVYQDFKQDIYEALTTLKDTLKKYSEIILLFPEHSNHPTEIIEGVKLFCTMYHKQYTCIPRAQEVILKKEQLYIAIEEYDLVVLIKKIRNTKLKMGKEIGLISFNETQLKELLEITVISTDFEQMGLTAANLILNEKFIQVKNQFKIYTRASI